MSPELRTGFLPPMQFSAIPSEPIFFFGWILTLLWINSFYSGLKDRAFGKWLKRKQYKSIIGFVWFLCLMAYQPFILLNAKSILLEEQ